MKSSITPWVSQGEKIIRNARFHVTFKNQIIHT